jgi:hypothetical protein
MLIRPSKYLTQQRWQHHCLPCQRPPLPWALGLTLVSTFLSSVLDLWWRKLKTFEEASFHIYFIFFSAFLFQLCTRFVMTQPWKPPFTSIFHLFLGISKMDQIQDRFEKPVVCMYVCMCAYTCVYVYARCLQFRIWCTHLLAYMYVRVTVCSLLKSPLS